MQDYIYYYLIGINTLAILLCLIDKKASARGSNRISEKTFLLIAVFGGSFGFLLSMYLFHHKTKHAKFYIGVPLIMILQLFLVWYFLK